MTITNASCQSQDIQKFDLPTSGFVDSNGLKIFFHRYGQGSPLVLVHGWGAETKSNWVDSGWVEVLQEHRTVISIDVRGHGKSDKPHALDPYSYQAMSQDVLAVLDAHKIKQSDFMGYSMGAFMGAYLLGHFPERFTSMVLGGIGDETERSAAQGGVIAEALRASHPSRISNPVGLRVREYVAANPDNDLESLAFSALKMWPEGYPIRIAGPNIKAARFPVLIVNGENDHPYVDSADRFAEALPNGKHVRLPAVDHLTAVSDERFKKLVVEFLTSR